MHPDLCPRQTPPSKVEVGHEAEILAPAPQGAWREKRQAEHPARGGAARTPLGLSAVMFWCSLLYLQGAARVQCWPIEKVLFAIQGPIRPATMALWPVTGWSEDGLL